MVDSPEAGSVLVSRFEEGHDKGPDRVALMVNGRSFTYAELRSRAMRLAERVLRTTPAPRRLGLLVPPGENLYVGLLAVLYTGAALVPLNTDSPRSRVQAMADSAEVCALVAEDPDVTSSWPGRRPPVVPVGTGEEEERKGLPALPASSAGSIAYILFTSGSTGRPKGVPISRENIDFYLETVRNRYSFTPDDVFSQTFTITFDLALFDLFAAWQAGARVVPVPPGAYLDLPGFLETHGVTVWFSTPSTIPLVRRGGGLGHGSLPTLRWSLFCGEALPLKDALDWRNAAVNSTVENLYGPTELTVSCSVHRWSEEGPPDSYVNGVVPIGRMHDGHDHVLIDEDSRPVPDEGELCVSGPQMFAGYLDPSDDEGRFLHHEGRRWYRTGDRVRRLAEGGLAYLGRTDHQVQIRGARIEPAEIECALRDLPGVEEAVTIALGRRLLSFYTGRPCPESELRAGLGLVLPAYMMPSGIGHIDGFPLNANGKVDRARLGEIAEERRL